MLPLDCSVQKYAWGKAGIKSTVAQLKKGGDDEFIISDDDHYAELWMGTHPSGPSKTVLSNGTRQLLKQYLREHPEAQGTVASNPEGDLPFMFKVLSISKALSIQAHPDKSLAERLHASNPKEYKDPNHKPEMAISLTDFEAMCGFRPLEEIADHLAKFPELRALVSDEAAAMLTPAPQSDSERRAALKAVFSSFITAPDSTADAQVSKLVSRLSSMPVKTSLESVLLRLANQYPGDRGMMGPLLLNYVTLGPGHAFVCYANEPHAYLSGDILECMACSDNVVRVGLTPKFRDVNTLINMLTYSSGPMTSTLGTAVAGNEFHRLFTPKDIDEFEVETVRLTSESTFELPPVNSASIILVISGSGVGEANGVQHALRKGTTFLLPANAKLQLEAGSDGIYLASAHANLSL